MAHDGIASGTTQTLAVSQASPHSVYLAVGAFYGYSKIGKNDRNPKTLLHRCTEKQVNLQY